MRDFRFDLAGFRFDLANDVDARFFRRRFERKRSLISASVDPRACDRLMKRGRSKSCDA